MVLKKSIRSSLSVGRSSGLTSIILGLVLNLSSTFSVAEVVSRKANLQQGGFVITTVDTEAQTIIYSWNFPEGGDYKEVSIRQSGIAAASYKDFGAVEGNLLTGYTVWDGNGTAPEFDLQLKYEGGANNRPDQQEHITIHFKSEFHLDESEPFLISRDEEEGNLKVKYENEIVDDTFHYHIYTPNMVEGPIRNLAPIADAGTNKSVSQYSEVLLNGSGSSDGNGDLLHYEWVLKAPSKQDFTFLSGSVTTSFLADEIGDYAARLTVSDGVLSASDTVIISVAGNSPPMANAGTYEAVRLGDTVTLDGTGSNDNESEVTFKWLVTDPEGVSVVLNGPNEPAPAFVASKVGIYGIHLTVTDSEGSTDSDTSSINVQKIPDSNTLPKAVVQIVNIDEQPFEPGDLIMLTGVNSSDVDGNALTFNWSISSRPDNSNSALDSSDQFTTSFSPDVDGDYVIQLIVNDGKVDSIPATVGISVSSQGINVAPVADAGPDQTVKVTEILILDGDGSTDPDNGPDTLQYQWRLISQPERGSAKLRWHRDLTDSQIELAYLTAYGSYVVGLVVYDGDKSSELDTVTVDVIPEANNLPPLANFTVPADTRVKQKIKLDASASNDPEGNSLLYKWTLTETPDGSRLKTRLSKTRRTFKMFTPDLAGNYMWQLIVNDGSLDSAAVTGVVNVGP